MKGGGIQRQLQGGGGPLGKYRRTMIGDTRGWVRFFLYELLLACVLPLPGKGAVRLRQLLLPFFFDSFGKDVAIERDGTFRRPSQIRIGNRVRVARGVTFDVKGDAGFIEIHDEVHIGGNTILSCPGGTMVIGGGSRIGESCRLGSLQGLSLGQGCRLGDRVCLVGAGHAHDRLDLPIIQQDVTCKGKTVIGDQVSIGPGATVLDGVRLGRGVTVAPGSLVNRDVEAGVCVQGVPARPCPAPWREL